MGLGLAARGESLASHRDGRGAPMARRDDREYREYLSEEQRSQRGPQRGSRVGVERGPQRGSRVGVERGCIARRMQPDFRHGLSKPGDTRPADLLQSGVRKPPIVVDLTWVGDLTFTGNSNQASITVDSA